jgi:D-serine deaminase-like pyridoxal phosphate-dependent protein
MNMKEWYIIDNVDELDSPQLVVYPDRVQFNIEKAKEMVGDISRLRPHVKTNKTPEVMRMMINAGITKFKCATIAEAEILGRENADDVLLAYQPVGPKVQRLIDLVKKYPQTKYSCLVDHEIALEGINTAFSHAGLVADIFLDINLGMNRTGITPGKAFDLYRKAAAMKNILVRGLHAYDGHFRDPDISKRALACNEAFEKIIDLKKQITGKGYPEPTLIAGGSPTFPIHSKRLGNECSPGTFVFWDKGYSDICPEQPFLPAALVVSRVISLPEEGRICTDLGHKSIAAENDIQRRAWFINAPELKLLSQSEEHGIAEAGPGHKFLPGDVLYVMPYHVCPTVALYDHMVVIENHLAGESWIVEARRR